MLNHSEEIRVIVISMNNMISTFPLSVSVTDRKRARHTLNSAPVRKGAVAVATEFFSITLSQGTREREKWNEGLGQRGKSSDARYMKGKKKDSADKSSPVSRENTFSSIN